MKCIVIGALFVLSSLTLAPADSKPLIPLNQVGLGDNICNGGIPDPADSYGLMRVEVVEADRWYYEYHCLHGYSGSCYGC